MELRHLRYFVAVAEKENVTRAAAELHVSQPALSRQIRDLEAELGFPLLERSPQAVRLTHAGRVFLNGAREVLRRVDAAVEKARAAAIGGDGELHIGYAPSPTAAFLPEVLRVHKKASSTRVILHDLTSDEMIACVRDGKLHAALMVELPRRRAEGLVFERLFSQPVGVFVPHSHGFSSKRAVTREEATRETLVAFSRKEYPDYHVWLRRWLRLPPRKIKLGEECDGVLSLIAAVESGRGIAVAPGWIKGIAGSRVAYIPLHPPPSPMFLGLCYRRSALRSAATRLFVETARAVAKQKG